MEPDEYYDSLEEEETEEKIQCPAVKKKLPYSDSLEEDDTDDVIPFYNGNLSLNKVNLSGNSSRCSGFLVNRNNRGKIRIPTAKPKKTYLKMFYERSGDNQFNCKHIEQAESEDYSKGTCYTLSPKSYTTCTDTNVNYDDAESVYLRSNVSESEISSNFDKLTMAVPKLHLDCNSESKYYSVSDNNMDSFKPNELNVNTKSHSSWYPKTCELGKIEQVVPNPKLESWRKRQQYGRKVSESNRIRMNERKILRNLERELQNSKLCVK